MPASLSGVRFLVLAATLLVVAIAPQGAAAQAAKAQTKVTLRLDWKPGGQHVPFYYGKAMGYYAAEGIDLTILAGSGSSDAVKQLGAGAVDMAIVDALVLTQAAEQKVPVKSVAVYYQRTPIALISPKTKPITDPKQLTSGAKIGTKRASTTSQALTALLASAHIDPKQVNIVDIGFGVQPLLVHQVDALMGFTMNESIEAEKAGMPVHELMVADHGVDTYGLVIASSDRFLKSNPEVVAAFIRATRRAVAESIEHKEAAAQSLSKAVSEIDAPREVLVLEKTAPFWEVRGKNVSSFGSQDLQGWQQTLDTAKRVGLLETAPAAKDLFVLGPSK